MMGVEVAFLRLLRLEIPSIEMWAAVFRESTNGRHYRQFRVDTNKHCICH
jgi:hypothetical protein